MAGTIITSHVKIGEHVQLNANTIIAHDCLLGDYFTTGLAANVCGGCTFGECVYFGTNAAIRQYSKVCDNVTVGMGGVVVKDIEEPGVYIGNPVKKLIEV